MLWSIDVDECSNSTLNTCDVNAECVDNEGSFRCLCNSGYTGDGNVCEGMFLTVLAMKFVIDERYLFVDIDECEVIMPCDRNALCSNSEGSFNCTCESGYSGDGTTCVGKISHLYSITASVSIGIFGVIVHGISYPYMKCYKIHNMNYINRSCG